METKDSDKKKGDRKRKKKTKKRKNDHTKKPKHEQPKQKGLTVLDIADELVVHVFSFLDITDLCRCSLVCHQWKDISQDDSLWKGMYNYYWEDGVKNWKQLFSAHYEDFETKDVELLNNELMQIDEGNRYAIFLLYRFRTQSPEERGEEEEGNAEEGWPSIQDNEAENQVTPNVVRQMESWELPYRDLWTTRDVFALSEGDAKGLVTTEIGECANSDVTGDAWRDWMSAFGGSVENWKEVIGYDTIQKVLNKRLTFNGYANGVGPGRVSALWESDADYYSSWILKYFPAGKTRLFVSHITLVDDGVYVQGFALLSATRFCTYWSEVRGG